MAIISTEAEIQERLSAVYEELINAKDLIRHELIESRLNYDKACDKHIQTGFRCEYEWIDAEISHQENFIKYDIYCHLLEIVNDFRDLYGQFPEYHQMYVTLNLIMLQLAREEKYELAAILKNWVDRINCIIKERSPNLEESVRKN
ncbi:hypothetical protein [Sphingobacterium pedocola]|uniref:Uncharacterized protein n=1 Tax=Sphingobacterium pedocola TaxID=2082722 RepID=A0ABR9TEA2_9SPHI|nr:hypothetical protein [Sphingobacterium pedocola]MBE8723204.1 hypothetical protein [Sphingobacterium pedocola]